MNGIEDKKKFADLMMALAEVFDNGRDPSAVKVEIYFKALENFGISDIDRAVSRMISTRVFASFPKPAEIIQEIDGSAEELALNAWSKVSYAIRHVGQYESVAFDDPVIHSVIEAMGGWHQMQEPNAYHPVFSQKEFMNLYPIKAKLGDHPEKCAGLFEDTMAGGYKDFIKPPVRIGTNNTGEIKILKALPQQQLTGGSPG
jgi:hypothetical protein